VVTIVAAYARFASIKGAAAFTFVIGQPVEEVSPRMYRPDSSARSRRVRERRLSDIGRRVGTSPAETGNRLFSQHYVFRRCLPRAFVSSAERVAQHRNACDAIRPVEPLQRDMPQLPNPKKLTHDQIHRARWTNSCMRVRRVGCD